MPELKHAAKNLKVKHLLQQSSGIHDFVILKNIAGWSDKKAFSIEDALSILSKQVSPAFIPGTEFSYSRSNMLLATLIIERASKLSFPAYLDKHIFKALGMNNSFVLSPENQRSNTIAHSYQLNEGEQQMKVIPSQKETYASINIVSSIEDMARWEMNFMRPSAKYKKAVDHFNSFVSLDNGANYSIPQGKLTYGQKYIHKERGIETAMSTGGIDGFASAIFNFPTEDFTVITLSNNGESYNGYIGMISAHSILADAFTEPVSIDFAKLKTIPLDHDYHAKFEGLYWDALGELSREIRIVNDSLRYIRSNGHSTALLPLSQDKFQMLTDFDDKIILNFSNSKGETHMSYEYGEASPILFLKYERSLISNEKLQALYKGTYFCRALNTTFNIRAQDGKLSATNEHANINFTAITDRLFSGDQWYMGSIEFQTDESATTQGFYLRNDAIRNLWFEKMD